jgi:HSP20 family protein
MRHIAEDMENMLADFDLGGRMFSNGFSRNPFGRNFSLFEETPFFMEKENFPGEWSPQVDMFERNGNLIVQAELPGVKKDDVKVEIVGNQLTIEGERKEETEEKSEGFYRNERSYGSFYRMLPLPEGINTENAKATFNDGVLEISMASPKLTQAAKRLEITEGEPKKAASNK